jgi:signal peptidase I
MAEDRPASRTFEEVAYHITASGVAFRFLAKGRSMLPTIQDGEILHVRQVDPASIKIGEIVLFSGRDGFKAHRVISKRRGVFVTRGDSSTQADGEVRGEQIVGKITAKECAVSGRMISLDGTLVRLRFFTKEARKLISPRLRRAATFALRISR